MHVICQPLTSPMYSRAHTPLWLLVCVCLCHPGGAPALSGWAMTGWLGLRFVYLMTTSLALGAGAGLGIALLLKKLPLAGPHQVTPGGRKGGGGGQAARGYGGLAAGHAGIWRRG